MTDDTKKEAKRKGTKKRKAHLRSAEAELEALRQQVHELESAADAAEKDDGSITKRDVVHAAWVAPVILSVNLPNSVFAQSALSPVSTPAPKDDDKETDKGKPTAAPAKKPGGPTAAPTPSAPTLAPVVPPTSAPVTPPATPAPVTPPATPAPVTPPATPAPVNSPPVPPPGAPS